jgi:hypothetical protein
MRPLTVDLQLLEAIEHYADATIADHVLLDCVMAERPSASLWDISHAALYAATDATRRDTRITVRLYNFAMNVRRSA